MNQKTIYLVSKFGGSIFEHNISEAAKLCGVSRRYFREILDANDCFLSQFYKSNNWDFMRNYPDIKQLKIISGFFPVSSDVFAYNLLPY